MCAICLYCDECANIGTIGKSYTREKDHIFKKKCFDSDGTLNRKKYMVTLCDQKCLKCEDLGKKTVTQLWGCDKCAELNN